MKNFIFKSNASDLQKMFSQIENIQRNVLYLTYRMDKVLKVTLEMSHDKDLQNTVDKYFDEKPSPQTDTETTTEEHRAYID